MSECGSFTRGLPAHAARCSDAGELPSFPSKPDHRPCSRHRKVRHVAREGRCGEERQTAWLFALRCCKASTEQRGQGRQPRTEEDRRLAGVPACRNRVAEIGSRNRGSEKRIVGPLLDCSGRRSVRGRELDLEVATSDAYVARRASARALRVTGRNFHRTNPLQLVGLTRGRNTSAGTWDR